MTLVALLGVKALWLVYAWLASAIIASYISQRKGYGERVGLATGLLLTVLGVLVWLVWPAKPDSRWKLSGVFGSGGGTVAEARAQRDATQGEGEEG